MKRPAWFIDLSEHSLAHKGIDEKTALKVLRAQGPDTFGVLHEANKVRQRIFGDAVTLCSILNVKSGGCSEDCAFCAQSAKYNTGVAAYPLVPAGRMKAHALKARTWGSHLGLITSGRSVLQGKTFERFLSDVRRIKKTCELHASLGTLTPDAALRLKRAGITTYHHNIETAPSFFSRIIRTHSFTERVDTIRHAKSAGLKVCSGGIVGLGESLEQRVEMAFTLRELAPDRIPLNFLNPIPGTPLGKQPLLAPMEALKIVAMFRLVNPCLDIRICGGRDKVLRELHPLVFFAGASGIMTGDYLTTTGRKPEDDLRMIRDLGLKVRFHG